MVRAGDHLRYDAHGRKNHDVDGRVAVEPEQMLEEDRVAATGGIENRQPERTFRDDQ
jgi:hypothetical protein